MKYLKFLFLTFIFYGLTVFASDFEVGKTYHGFKLLKKKFVKEVNAECLYFEHTKSGARLLKIAADDMNKTFSIAFKTDPESDCGTPHILEHSVLTGSKNFPVKGPFEEIGRTSLKTYYNAWTGADFTCYPFASMNTKDYFNLIHIYMDAVFNPLLHSDPMSFYQEGWHYDLQNTKDPVEIKGIVYNEMKGAYSNPNRLLSLYTLRALFPDNGYRFSSGGFPEAIPELSYEMFKNYHKKYYHPVNSHIMLYGNADLNKELEFIDSKYLSNYTMAPRPKSFPIQKAPSKMKEVREFYPASDGAPQKDQTYLAMSFVAGLNTDRATVMALNFLCNILVNQEAAPIRLALQKAGIGKDVSADLDEYQQNIMNITVQNANPEDAEKFREIVFATLKDVIKTGIDKKQLEGLINRTEFNLREGNDNQKGVTYNFQILPGWFFADDPYLTLEYEQPLAKIKTALKTDMLGQIIKKELLENPHSVLVVLSPKEGIEKESSIKLTQKLESYKKSLSENEINNLVKSSQQLLRRQSEKDTPEALATIPRLSREDIKPEAEWFSIEEKVLTNVPVLFSKQFTSKIVYTKLLFDLKSLPENLLPYASLLTSVLGSQDTKNYTYPELIKDININTGGLNYSLYSYLRNLDDNKVEAQFAITSKSMVDKLDQQFSLISEIINNTKFGDTARLKEILNRLESRLEAQIKGEPFYVAERRLYANNFRIGVLREKTEGLDYYWFIKEMNQNIDKNIDEISQNLERVAKLIFTKANLGTAVTCSEDEYKSFTNSFGKFIKTLPDTKKNIQNWSLQYQPVKEAVASSSKVQYVMQGFDIKKLGYKWNGMYSVLSQILSNEYLHNQIRVIGGAYGGFSGFYNTGKVYFGSYRDPNLSNTLTTFNGIPEYLEKLELNDEELTGHIISTIAGYDTPLTPEQKGSAALDNYLRNITKDDLQRERNEIINTKLADLKASKKMIKEILEKNSYSIYGNEQEIEKNKNLFNTIKKFD